jgi:hypothetical protein
VLVCMPVAPPLSTECCLKHPVRQTVCTLHVAITLTSFYLAQTAGLCLVHPHTAYSAVRTLALNVPC